MRARSMLRLGIPLLLFAALAAAKPDVRVLAGPAGFGSDKNAVAAFATGNTSGIWFAPQFNGQGWFLVIPQQGGNFNLPVAVAAWFTYDAAPSTAALWLYASAQAFNTDGSIDLDVLQLNGTSFPPNFTTPVQRPWGRLRMEFNDCNTGVFSWTPVVAGFAAGSVPVQRIFGSEAATCAETEAQLREVPNSCDTARYLGALSQGQGATLSSQVGSAGDIDFYALDLNAARTQLRLTVTGTTQPVRIETYDGNSCRLLAVDSGVAARNCTAVPDAINRVRCVFAIRAQDTYAVGVPTATTVYTVGVEVP